LIVEKVAAVPAAPTLCENTYRVAITAPAATIPELLAIPFEVTVTPPGLGGSISFTILSQPATPLPLTYHFVTVPFDGDNPQVLSFTAVPIPAGIILAAGCQLVDLQRQQARLDIMDPSACVGKDFVIENTSGIEIDSWGVTGTATFKIIDDKSSTRLVIRPTSVGTLVIQPVEVLDPLVGELACIDPLTINVVNCPASIFTSCKLDGKCFVLCGECATYTLPGCCSTASAPIVWTISPPSAAAVKSQSGSSAIITFRDEGPVSIIATQYDPVTDTYRQGSIGVHVTKGLWPFSSFF